MIAADAKIPTTIQNQIVRTISSACRIISRRPRPVARPSGEATGSPALPSRSRKSASQPPKSPVTAAAATLKIAKGQPRKDALTRIESTPVCGVLIRKPTVAPLLAPSLRRPSPAGITPQEHSGSGTPSRTALSTPKRPLNWSRTKRRGKAMCKTPATAIPSNRYGANSSSTCHMDRTRSIASNISIAANPRPRRAPAAVCRGSRRLSRAGQGRPGGDQALTA